MTETTIKVPQQHKILTDQDVARVAYFYWEHRGRPFGSPEVDWFRAEADLRLQQEEFDLGLDPDGRLPFSSLDMSPRTFEN
jgi:hypothetical protein